MTFNYFKKVQRKQHPGKKISNTELEAAFVMLSDNVRHESELGAEKEEMIVANISTSWRWYYKRQMVASAGRG